MRAKEAQKIRDYCSTLSNEEIKKYYYDSVYDCLGSDAERMIELDYCESDIKEARALEKYNDEKSDIVEDECMKRGIELWNT